MAGRAVVVHRTADGQAASAHDGWADAVAAAVAGARDGAAVGVHVADDEAEAEARATALAIAADAGAVLVSSFVADLIGGSGLGYQACDLGSHRLADLAPARPVAAVAGPGLVVPRSVAGIDSVPNDLPMRVLPFVGRTQSVAAVVRALDVSAIVTVVGPGGAGKTELALRAAAASAAKWTGGVWLVELSALDADDVAGAVKESLGGPGDGPALVVVDCCEHVIDAARQVAGDVLTSGDVAVLATSRTPLGVEGERLVEIGPLDDGDAATLFASRARATSAAFSRPAEDPDVVALCRRLDRLPLAIELAATRSRIMSPAEIATRLGEGIDALPAAPNPRQAHHRTLRAAVQWSYDLLDDAERAVFRGVGVFNGGFDIAAALHVCGRGVSGEPVIDALDGLVAHSLLTSDPDLPEPLRMLDSVRAFARERLASCGDELADARGGLVEWLLDASVLCDAADANRSPLYDRLDRSPADVRLAIEHAVSTNPAAAVVLIGRLWSWFWQRGRTGEGRSLARLAMDVDTGVDPLATARLLNAAANLAVDAGDAADAVPLYERSLALRRAHDEPAVVASVLNDLGVCHQHLGELDVAQRWLDESVCLARSAGDRWTLATALLNRANLAAARSDFDAAAGAYESAAAVYDELGDVVTAAAARANLGLTHLAGGRVDLAASLLGDAARVLVADGARSYLPTVLDGCASSALAAGDAETAARLWGGAAAVARESGASPGPASADLARQLAETLGAARRDALAREGADLDLDEVVDLVGGGGSVAAFKLVSIATATDVAAVRDEGDSWSVTFAGRTAHVRRSKGLGYLARLLAEPGREHHVLDLAGGTAHGQGVPVIDDTARDAYRRRIAALRAEIDEAESAGAAGRADAAARELDALTAELAAAYGLSGRSRRAGDDVERARKAVTNRIRDAVRAVAAVHPELGRHLERAVRTGMYCRYDPEMPLRWDVSA